MLTDFEILRMFLDTAGFTPSQAGGELDYYVDTNAILDGYHCITLSIGSKIVYYFNLDEKFESYKVNG